MAHARTVYFLDSLPRIREMLQTDVEAAFDGDPAALSKEEVLVSYPFVEAIAVQRLAHELFEKNVPLIPRIMTEWAHWRSGMEIHPGAKIGSHFFVDHCTGTVVGETATIGQAGRIDGITPAALTLLVAHVRRRKGRPHQLQQGTLEGSQPPRYPREQRCPRIYRNRSGNKTD